jgi:hypothetical protein
MFQSDGLVSLDESEEEEEDDDEEDGDDDNDEEEDEEEAIPEPTPNPPPGVTVRDVELFKKVQQTTADVCTITSY